MASFCVSAPSNISSLASSLSGLSLASSPRPSARISTHTPVRAVAVSKTRDAVPESSRLAEERDMRRRAVVFAAFASALSLASAGAGLAEVTKKKEKCPTICVQNRTASCCYGH